MAVASLLAVQASLVLVVRARSGPLFDDFVNVFIAFEQGLDPAHLFDPNFDHFGLGYRLLNHVVLFKSGFAGWAVTGAILLCGLAVGVAMWRLAVELAGAGWGAVVCVGLVVLSPLWANARFWWPSATDHVVSFPMVLLATSFAHRRIAGGSRWWSLATLVPLALALVFRERAVVVPLLFGCLAVALIPERLSFTSVARTLWKLIDLWVACLALLGTYIALMLKGGYLKGELPGEAGGGNFVRTPMQLGSFLWRFLEKTLFPSLIGVLPGQWEAGEALTTVALVVLVVEVGIVLWVIPRGWRALVVVGLPSLVSTLPFALGRGGQPAFALEPRYGTELLPYLGVGLALLVREVHQGRLRSLAPWRAQGLRAVGTGALLVSGVLGLISADRYQRTFFLEPLAHRFHETVEHLRLAPGETVLEGTVPAGLLLLPPEVGGGGWAALSSVLRVQRPELSIADPQASSVAAIGQDGEVRHYHRGPATMVPCEALKLNGARTPGDGICATTMMVVSMPVPSGVGIIGVEINWGSSRPYWVIPVRIDESGGLERGVALPVAVSQYPMTSIMTGTTREVGFEFFNGCITGLSWYPLEPRDDLNASRE